MFNKLTIKAKMLIILFSIVFSFFILVFLIYQTESSTNKNKNLVIDVEKLKSSMLMLRRHEKDFLLRKKLKYRDEFLNSYKVTLQNAHILEKELNDAGFKSSEVVDYIKIIQKYKADFLILTKEQIIIGLNETLGLRGALRDSVHKVQDYAKSLHKWELLARVYELRKNEKDFMLRKSLKYINEHKKHFDALIPLVQNKKMLQYLKIYQKDLLNLVEAEVKIGLNEKLGMRGKMRNTVHKTETLLYRLENSAIKFGDIKEKSMFVMSFSIAVIFMIILLIIILLILKNLMQSIDKFKIGLLNFFDFLDKKRDDIDTIKLNSNDELGKMAEIVNEHIKQTVKILKDDHNTISNSISVLEKMVYTDPLTKIYNRQKFMDSLAQAKENKKRYGDKVSLIMLDIDYFKNINDAYGHDIGDKVLITLTKIIKQHLRVNDIFARWGGEEFMILMPRTDIEEAYNKAKQLRKVIEEYENNQLPKFTVSFGVTEILDTDKSESCYIRVDKALYQAKIKRNDVVKING